MILRKDYHLLYGVILVSLIAISGINCQEADSKSYDENDWIPIAPKHAQSAQPVVENVEKKATGRVLNLAEPPANSFFPDEAKPTRNNNFQQYLRETTTYQKVPVHQHQQQQQQQQGAPVRVKQQLQHPYKFDSHRPAGSGAPQIRPAKPQKEFYVQQQTQQPQQAQFVQYYQPQEYHTIPEEYLNQQLPQGLPQHQYFGQNFEIPDLPPIRLNATPSRFEKKPKPVHQFDSIKNEDKDNVQLLYVPLESLQSQGPKRPLQSELPRLHAYQQAPIADLPSQFINYRPIPSPAKQQQLHNIQSDFAKQAFDAHKLQLQLQQQPQPEEYTLPATEAATEPPTTTTKKPATKKRKAHQPPLAVYMGGATHADVSDVLTLLKNAKTIEVQDSVGPHSPHIFVGPSNLEAPRGYAKFELPYLSSLDTNRVERKVDQYPFFVAPLSYKAPPGYSKIPLPSPHVGSVVVSTKEKEATKPAQHSQNLPDAYQEFSQQNQPQAVPQYEYQQRPSPVPSSTPRYSKPISEEHVINQHEIDQINSFIPQFNENVREPEPVHHRFQETAQRGHENYQREPQTAQRGHENYQREPQTAQRGHETYQREPQQVQRVPENYHADSFKPSTSPARPSTIRFASTAQPQLSEQEFIDEILQQQQQPSPSPVRHEEYIRPSPVPTHDDGQYHQEVTRPLSTKEQYTQEDDNTKYENQQSTRTTHPHSSTRSRTTAAPPLEHEQYEEEITKPTRVRTRPTHAPQTHVRESAPQTHVRESYEIPSRTTHVRSRPTPTPAPTTPEPVDQYLKETVIEARPKPRPSPTSTTEKPKYSIQEQFSIGRSTSPSPLQYSPVAQEYEEEIKPHRPIIFKYKQSEEIPTDYQPPIYHSSTPKTPIAQHQSNQEELDTKILSHESTGSGNFVTGPAHQIYQYQEEYEEPQQEQVRTQNANVENYNIAHVSQPHGQLPNLINNLEDQSVRQLLHPGLIPTSPKTGDVERYEISTHSPLSTTQLPTSNYPSTHLPVVETTTQRKVTNRGRVRGNRFSTTTPSSVSSTRRAPVTRGRRPLPSRTRYQDENEQTTEYTVPRSTTDPTKKIVTARSRFRTRGRPVVETTDRASSVYEQIDVTPAHIQNSHPPSVQIIEPHVTQRVNQEYINYRPIYNVPVEESEPVLISTKKVTKPATEPVVIHQINQLPIKNLEEENTENTSSKLRVRGRRPSTTAAPQVDTSRKYEAERDDQGEGEFYGFFREPAFKNPTEPAPPAETPRSIYSSTYVSSTLKPLIHQEEIQPQVRYHSSTENVQFVGEIRPKYQTTPQYYEPRQASISTERFYQTTEKEVEEEEKPRVRTRARIPTRRIVASETSERAKVIDEPKTITQRPRTRGKTSYRVPQKPKKKHESGEDEDVEGGNYPPQFKAFQTTPRPSFQITVDPQDDQEGFPSIYRPTYVAKENNNKEIVEKGQGHWVENYQMPNYIPSDGKVDSDVPIALPSIATAPEVNQAIQEEQEKIQHNEESVEKIVEDMIQEYEDNVDDKEVKTDAPIVDDEDEDLPESFTTTAPETTTHKRRRGVWKLVRRPVDDFEGAESQNAASNKNNLETDEKPVSAQGVQDFHSEVNIEFTTLPMTTITEAEATTLTSSSPSTTEAGFFDSIYDMFGIAGEKTKLEEHEDKEEPEVTTTAKPFIIDTTLIPETVEPEADTQTPFSTTTSTTTTTTTMRPPVEIESTTPLTSMTYITPMSLETWNKGILKTSTSTEISHETEICYKGKCIKSKDMKVPMT